MRKLIYALAALGALAWPGAALAVLQETTVTITDHGEPLPNATITLNRLTDSEPPPETKTEKTDDSGKIVLEHRDEDKASDSTVEVIVTTREGKTFTHRLVLKELLTHETVEVVVPTETQMVEQSSHHETANQCTDLTKLDDQQLHTIISTPELRERIVRLIEETKQSEETKQTEEAKTIEETKEPTAMEAKTEEPAATVETKTEEHGQPGPTKEAKTEEGKKGPEKKTVTGGSKQSKQKEVVQKKRGKQPTASAAPKGSPGAAEIVGTGLSIGLGIAGSRHGGGKEHRRGGMESGHSMGMERRSGGVGAGF